MKQETFLLSSENNQVECPSCKNKYINNQGAGVSNHLRKCCPKVYLWFLIPTIMNRSINILDLLQCFERNAIQTVQWFEGIWGNQYSFTRMRNTMKDRTKGKTIKELPDFDVKAYLEITDSFRQTIIWNYDYKANSLYPDMKQTLESLPDYESFQPLIFGDSQYTTSKIEDIPPEVIPKPIALPGGHYNKDTETLCITIEEYEYYNNKGIDFQYLKETLKASSLRVQL